jgi:hypothetical protein
MLSIHPDAHSIAELEPDAWRPNDGRKGGIDVELTLKSAFL